jgi:hypothetical protein
MREATGEALKTLPPAQRTEKNRDAIERGRKGGKKGGSKGGKRRAANMSDEERAKGATIAALARWKRTT